MKDEPLVRVKSGDRVYYPRFEKDTQGIWRLTDPSFQPMIERQFSSAEPAKKEKE